MENVLTSFYLKWDEHINACLQALSHLLVNFDPDIQETTKYGMACFLYKGKHKFYLGIDLNRKSTSAKANGDSRKEPYVLFVDGNRINDPRLEQGSRKRMKIYRVNPNQDINKEELYELLKIAIQLPKK